MRLVFVEAPAFTRHRESYLDDAAYAELQAALLANPAAGAVIPGTGGFRKVRWPDSRRGMGKRGGLRVIYCCMTEASAIWLFTIYGKNEMADLSAPEKLALRRALAVERAARSGKP
jgi:hypothetical protein